MAGDAGVDTIVAAATPPGVSALAIVRASGPLCAALGREALEGRELEPRRAARVVVRTRENARIDEAVAILYPRPASFTGEDVLEVVCHGNPLIVNKIVDDWCRRGCRLAEPGEFTRRALENGRLDLAQAEAVLDVILARTDRELAAAQAQLSGRLGTALNAVRGRLVEALARCEAYLDFPEEDLDPEDVMSLDRELARAQVDLEQLRATELCGRLLRDGVRVVLVGAPNAGKSSVLNALCGEERMLVHEEPGTTRDFVEHTVIWDGWRVILTDTAGLRETLHPVERAGIERTCRCAASADVVVSVESPDTPRPTLPTVRADATVIRVLNKADLLLGGGSERVGLPSVVVVSSRTGEGIQALRAAVVEAIGRQASLGADSDFCVNARHAAALAEATGGLGRARDRLKNRGSDVLVAHELRGALDAVGRITGRIEVEEVLDALFARFCIGK